MKLVKSRDSDSEISKVEILSEIGRVEILTVKLVE